MVVVSRRLELQYFTMRMSSYPVGLDLSSIFSKTCVKRQVKIITDALQYFRP